MNGASADGTAPEGCGGAGGGSLPSHHGVGEERAVEARPANEALRLLLERASCRDFSERTVPEAVLEPILSAAAHAATGGNLQPYSIIRIENEESRAWLAGECGQPFMRHAPVHLLFCLDWHRLERWAALEDAPFTASRSFRHFWISFQDVIVAAQSVCSAADACGLGSVYIGTVIDLVREVRERFGLPDGVFPVVLLCLGFPASRSAPRRKLGAGILVHRERYQDPADAELLSAMRTKYDGLRVEPTPERMETLASVCRAVAGAALADRALRRVREYGFINPVQRYFGLHYRADRMARGNAEFLAMMDEAGLGWFRPDAGE